MESRNLQPFPFVNPNLAPNLPEPPSFFREGNAVLGPSRDLPSPDLSLWRQAVNRFESGLQQPAASAGAASPPPASPDLQTGISNIIRTGSASAPAPAPAPAPAALTDEQRFGLQAAQDRLNAGTANETDIANLNYAKANGLWTPSAGSSSSSSSSSSSDLTTGGTTSNQPAPQSESGFDIAGMRRRADALRQEAFASVYGYTPDAWQNLDPAAQRRLRNQRVQGIIGELGNVTAAIDFARQEEDAVKSTALETLNTYLKFGVTDKVDPKELESLANQAGLSFEAVKAMGDSADPPELRSVDGNLYAIQWNPDTKKFDTELVLAGSSGSGGSGGSGSGSNGGSGSATVEVYDAETGAFLGVQPRPSGILGDKVLYDRELNVYREMTQGAGSKSADELFLDYAEQTGLSKLTQTERERYFNLKSGGSGSSSGNEDILNLVP